MRVRHVLAVALVSALAGQGCTAITGRSLQQIVTDTALTTQVKSRLAATEGFATLRSVDVNTWEDVVELRGIVADEATRDRMEREARRFAGDNRVVNNLEVANQAPAAASR